MCTNVLRKPKKELWPPVNESWVSNRVSNFERVEKFFCVIRLIALSNFSHSNENK